MDEAKIKKVFSDATFVKELLELDTPSEVQSALKAKDIDMTESEIMELREQLIKAAGKVNENGELSLDVLDEAAGGSATAVSLIAIGAATVVGTVIGPVVAGGVAAAAGGVYAAAKGIGWAVSNRRW